MLHLVGCRRRKRRMAIFGERGDAARAEKKRGVITLADIYRVVEVGLEINLKQEVKASLFAVELSTNFNLFCLSKILGLCQFFHL